MQVTLNGEALEIADNCSVSGLLEQLQIGRERVAVEVNLEIVPKSAYDSRTLAAEDRIEIVHFVGGGNISQS